MGRYSNHGEMASHLGELSDMIPESTPIQRKSPTQVQHRLGSDEADQMVTDYQAGAKIKDLAARYRINRNTVIGHINRTGVRRHYPALVSEEIMRATQLYQSGRSLAAIGRHFGVNASTIRTALLRAGVAMRDCQGRER